MPALEAARISRSGIALAQYVGIGDGTMNSTQSQQTRREQLLRYLGLMGILILGTIGYWSVLPAQGCQRESEQAVFDWAFVENANPLPNGMMWVGYRDREDGTIRHVSFHRIVRVLPGIQPDLPVEEALRFTVLITAGTLDPITYIFFREPLYYGTDLDELGLPRRMWLDPEEDGVNGNERAGMRVAIESDERVPS